jgi:DNA-binding CsgD family transcriptional regulator
VNNRLDRERVRGDLDVLSRAGLGLDEFLREATSAVQRAVPWVAACVATHDPSTMMMTSGRKYGALAELDSRDTLFARLEYANEEPTSFRALASGDRQAIGMHDLLDGDADRSARMNQLMRPVFGFQDESRLLFRDSIGAWGGMALFREHGDPWFATDEIDYLATLSGFFARGVRAGILTRLADSAVLDEHDGGPAVIIFDAADEIVQCSLGAERRIRELNTAFNRTEPMSAVFALVAAARHAGLEAGGRFPRARVRTASGMWLVLHATPLAASDGITGNVVVTIEEARPPEIVELVVAAFGLTARERDVTRMVLQGVETKEIAASLHVSAYTVQDHLKAVFEKADVRSRRELVSRIYFDQYVPRIGAEVGSSGWFVGADRSNPASAASPG